MYANNHKILDKTIYSKELEKILAKNNYELFLQKFYTYELIGGAENFFNASHFLLNNPTHINIREYYIKTLFDYGDSISFNLRALSYGVGKIVNALRYNF